MRSSDLFSLYEARINACDLSINKIKKLEMVFAVVKLFIATSGVFFLFKITALNQNLYLILLLTAMFLFGVAAVGHENIIKKRKKIETLKQVNEFELKALKHEFPGSFNGEYFRNEGHNFSNDLDIFGAKSVFHYINRSHTSIGQKTLASQLESASERAIQAAFIQLRQQAVLELTPALDLRQNIQVHGKQISDSAKRLDALSVLLEEPQYISQKRLLITTIRVAPVITLALFILLGLGIPWPIPVAAFIIQTIFNRRYQKKNNRIYLLTSRNARILKAYASIIAEIENSDFSSTLLQELRRGLSYEERPASYYIHKFSRIFSFFELRQSELLHFFLDNLLFWDMHCIFFIEKWKQKIAPKLLLWFDSIGQFEALASMASLYFNHPEWVLPEIKEGEFSFAASSLGHFLIPKGERVNNDISLQGNGNILVVTGPNMAGKSTFLKTVGVNLALALAGGPVCALSCSFVPVRLYSSMKISDSLDKNLSLFYAELQRLKIILSASKEKEPIFFLLDEILKGTNALDRQMGAFALLKQLTALGASGIVATHDLELTKLEKEHPGKIMNCHFDGLVEGDQLIFDYRLKKGRCMSFNALVLMRRIGIDI